MLSRNHRVYEVWNEWASESVFVDRKPSRDDIKELVEKNEWDRSKQLGLTFSKFVRKYIHIERLQHFYTEDPRTYRMERGED